MKRLLLLSLVLSMFVVGCDGLIAKQVADEIRKSENLESIETDIIVEEKNSEVPTTPEETVSDNTVTENSSSTSEAENTELVPRRIDVAKIKEDFDMNKIVADEFIDLTCEPELDLDKSNLIDSKDELEYLVYNRLITVTGTKLDVLLDSFVEEGWTEIVRENHKGMLSPYTTMQYSITFPDSLDNTLVLTIANMTDDFVRVGECPIYSVKVRHQDGYESVKSMVNDSTNIKGIDNGYNLNIFNSKEYGYSICSVSPLYESVQEYIDSLESNAAVLEDVESYEVGSNIIKFAGKTIDFNEFKLVDYLKNFECSKFTEIPMFYVNVNLHDEVVYNEENPFKIYGKASCHVPLKDLNDLHVNVGSYRVPSETNLYTAPATSVFTNFMEGNNITEEVYNFGGVSNLTKGKEIQDWFEKVKETKAYTILSDKDVIYPLEDYETILLNGIQDEEFMQYSTLSGFSYMYIINKLGDGYNISLTKSDV